MAAITNLTFVSQIILLVSILIHLVAAALAFRLISLLGWNRAWVLLAVALGFQVVRRVVAFPHIEGGTRLFEMVISLVISLLMLLGVMWIRPLLVGAQRAQSETQKSMERFQLLTTILQESQRQLDTLLRNLPGMAYRCQDDADWTMIFVSDGCHTLTGYQAEELIGSHQMSFAELIHPDDQGYVRETVRQQIEAGVPFQLTYRIQTKDGEQKWVWEQGIATRTSDGQHFLEGLIVDVTRQKEAEVALAAEKEQYQLLAENASDVIWTLSLDGRFTYVSPSVEQLRGYTPEEVLNQSIEEALTPESLAIVLDQIRQLQEHVQTGLSYAGPDRYELEQPCKDGSTVWTEVSVSLLEDEAGHLTGVLGVTRDITRRRATELALRQQMVLNEKILGTMQDGYLLVDIRGNLLDVNDAYCSCSGYSRHDLLHMTIADLDAVETGEQVMARIGRVLEHGTARFETQHRHRDGHAIDVEISVAVLDWIEEPLLAVFVQDISMRKYAQTLLEESRERFRIISELSADYAFSMVMAPEGMRLDWMVGAVREITGYTMQAIQAAGSIDHIIHPEDLPTVQAHIEAVLQNRTSAEIGYRIVRPDGEIRYLSSRFLTMPDRKTGQIRLFGSATDITRRYEAEQALRFSEEKFSKAFDASPIIIIITDVETGQYVEVNEAFIAVTGFSRQEAIGATSTALNVWLDPGERGRLLAPLEHGEPVRGVETSFRIRSGEIRDTVVSVDLIALKGRPHYVWVIRDVTDQKRMEERLMQEHNLLRTLIDNLPDAVYVKDTDARYLLGNIAVAQLMGVDSPEALLDRTDRDFFPKKIADLHMQSDRIVLEKGEPVLNLEVNIHDQEGRMRWLLTNKLPLFNSQGQLIGLVGIGRDITELREALDAERDQRIWAEVLRDSAIALSQTMGIEATLDQILEDVGRVVPHDSANIRLNKDGIARVARSRGRNAQVPEVLAIDQYDNLNRMATTGQPLIIPDITQDQAWVYFEGYHNRERGYLGAPILRENEVIGFIQLMSDEAEFFTPVHAERLKVFAAAAAIAIQNARLFEQVQAYASRLELRVAERTAELEASEARYRAIVEDQLEMVVRYTPDGMLTFVNSAYCRLTGQSSDDLLGESIMAQPLFGERADFGEYLKTLTPDNPVGVVDLSYTTEDGSPYWIQWTDRVILAEQGWVIEYQSVGRDVSQLKQMEQQLRRALEREISISEMRSRFMAMAAHDLRNPLAAIKTTVDLLLHYHDRLPDEKKKARLESADDSIRVMVELLDDILTIGRVESGRLEFNPAPLALEPFCWKLVDEITAASGAYSSIRLRFEGDRSQDTLYLDARLLRHILTNLLSNAVKYSPDGTPVDFRVGVTPDGVTFAIQDYGIGIPEDEQYLVFESFRRFGNVGRIPGTGLGLAIVQRAVETHGGTVAFESVEHVGTTFTVHIPSGAPPGE